MNYIKRKLQILKAVAFVTYKEWSAYRTHSLVSVFVGPVYFIVQYFIWTAVYGGSVTLGGMEFMQTVRYFGASALIGYLTMDFADWNLQMLVRTGKFLTFTLRPMHHRFFALSQKIGHRVLGFFFEFLPCLLIFALLFRVDIIPQHIFWTVLSVALAFLMNFYVNYCLGMTAFYFVQANGIRVVYQLLGSIFFGSAYSAEFFPRYHSAGDDVFAVSVYQLHSCNGVDGQQLNRHDWHEYPSGGFVSGISRCRNCFVGSSIM